MRIELIGGPLKGRSFDSKETPPELTLYTDGALDSARYVLASWCNLASGRAFYVFERRDPSSFDSRVDHEEVAA